jgi:hypothetical protein
MLNICVDMKKAESEVEMADLGGLMKQSKELINSAYNKGYKQAIDDMLNKQTVGLEKDILAKIEEVENEPTGARYWVSTQELRKILERY